MLTTAVVVQHHHHTHNHHATPHREPQVAYTPQQKLQIEAMNKSPAAWQPTFTSQDDRLKAAQLAHLASQHQLSDYNRLKFGLKGGPFSYIPISLQFPAHVEELRVRQAESAKRRAWWPSELVPTDSPKPRPHQHSTTVFASSMVYTPPRDHSQPKQSPSLHPPLSDSLQHELSLAMSSQLSLHSTQLSLHAQALVPKTSETHPINISLIVPFELVPIISSHIQKTSAACPTLYHLPPSFQLDRLLIAAPFSPAPSLARIHRTESAPAAQPASHPRDNYPPEPYPALPTQNRSMSNPLPRPTAQKPAVLQFNPAELASTLELDDAISVELPPSPSLSPPASPPLPTPPPTPPVLLGNLLLSSCPGKKVRLTGPVKGRGAICRDLRSDLHRVRDLGVGCIVCCLDDDELDFLGASWNEYSQIANSIGLDVLRLPTPEGLAPLQPRFLDEHLSRTIEHYTLRGIPILVHCRGGVGRAGLIACCWMLKLGMVGNVVDPKVPILPLIERVITVIRRRRSIKAIETFEQVRFLVDFVEYLREQHAGLS